MGLMREHEMHRRRRGRNFGLLAVLGALVAILFGLSIVKIGRGDFSTGTAQTAPSSQMEVTDGS